MPSTRQEWAGLAHRRPAMQATLMTQESGRSRSPEKHPSMDKANLAEQPDTSPMSCVFLPQAQGNLGALISCA